MFIFNLLHNSLPPAFDELFYSYSYSYSLIISLTIQEARNKHQTDVEDIVLHDAAVTKSIEDLHESGEEVIRLDSKTFQYALNENDLVFVDFFASWSVKNIPLVVVHLLI